MGLVLSGGGAYGLSHIGVIRALEENNVPIDYIAGTSMGALIGAMYSVGMSPDVMEANVRSPLFRNMAAGVIEEKYVYYFKTKEENASWVTLRFKLDSTIHTSLPTNIISPYAMDFGLLEYTSGSIASAGYKFDSLFVPFRCVAADIENKEQVVFRDGDLAEAVRASISYPFYLKPIKSKGKLLFDGGLYNNFPSDVMYEDFMPDFIIGSNVVGEAIPMDENNAISQLKTMLMAKTNYTVICDNGVIIEPHVDNIGLFDYSNPMPVIDSGYTATIRRMKDIKEAVKREVGSKELQKRRLAFLDSRPDVVFDNIYISGLNKYQSKYVRATLRQKQKQIPIAMLKYHYFRLASDDKIKSIYPRARYNPSSGFFDLSLDVKKDNDIVVQFGGNFSNRPINQAFVALEYKYLGTSSIGVAGNFYVGKFYNSAQVKARGDYPLEIPFYVETGVTINSRDYFRSSTAFFEDSKPSFLVQTDRDAKIDLGLPFGNRGKVIFGASYDMVSNSYYQTTDFTRSDITDKSDFNFLSTRTMYENNTLNRKMYANEGKLFRLSTRFATGKEESRPGSTSFEKKTIKQSHQWVQLKIVYDNYFKRQGKFKMGAYGELVASSQGFLGNYTATTLMLPAFQPIPESKTLFLEKFRAFQYAGAGLKNIYAFRKSVDVRIEGYMFLPYREVIRKEDFTAEYARKLQNPLFMGTGALVYSSPVGPVSFSINYYQGIEKPWSFLFHFGYILFNEGVFN